MKKLALVAFAASLALGGCQTAGTIATGINTANNALARLAGNDIPAACAIISVAEGYFGTVSSLHKFSPATMTAEAKAEAIVANICAHPPANVGAAFGQLMSAWQIIQAKTTVPAGG